MNQSKKFSLALVTGASSGIGSAFCHLLAQRKIPLLITGRSSSSLNALADQLRVFVPVIVFEADLAVPKDRALLIEIIRQHVPDLVVNNAGFGLYGEALTYETREQVEIVDVNATSVLELTLESARTMIGADKKGVILNISSAAYKLVFPCFATYAATKAFVAHFSKSLDYELSPRGIRVLTACPGVVSTSFRKRASGMDSSSNDRWTMSADFAANQLWKQIETGKQLKIFDWKTRFGLYLASLLPEKWSARLLANRVESYHAPRQILK